MRIPSDFCQLWPGIDQQWAIVAEFGPHVGRLRPTSGDIDRVLWFRTEGGASKGTHPTPFGSDTKCGRKGPAPLKVDSFDDSEGGRPAEEKQSTENARAQPHSNGIISCRRVERSASYEQELLGIRSQAPHGTYALLRTRPLSGQPLKG